MRTINQAIEEIAVSMQEMADQNEATSTDLAFASGSLAALCTFLTAGWDEETRGKVYQILGSYHTVLALFHQTSRAERKGIEQS